MWQYPLMKQPRPDKGTIFAAALSGTVRYR